MDVRKDDKTLEHKRELKEASKRKENIKTDVR